jgi:hypothetical protein
VAELENLRTRLESKKKEKLLALCDRKKISLQDVMDALVEFLLDQDDLTQSMILRQVAPRADLIAHSLRAMTKPVLNSDVDTKGLPLRRPPPSPSAARSASRG